MADGKIVIETGIDTSGIEKGISTVKSALAAIGIGSLVKDVIDTGSAFDTAMSQVQATMGITADAISDVNGQSVNTMDSLTALAQQLGSETAFSASECAEGLNYLALAGYNTQQMTDTLPTVLNLAAAGAMELGDASDMVTDAMSALGLTTDDASMMVDQMAKTASSSNTSVAQLGEAILTIGATGKTVSGGVTELNTALGILANNGIKGSEGGTHLRNVLMSLQSPTDQAAGMMKSLGLEVYDAEGNMRPLNDILTDLNDSMDGMTTADKQNIISTIFNKTDVAAASALLDNCGESWDNLTTAIEDSAGAADQMANTQLDNLEGKITILQSALEGFKLALWENMRDPLESLADIGTNVITELTDALKTGGAGALVDCAANLISEFATGIGDALPTLIPKAAEMVVSIINGITRNLPKIISAGISILKGLVQGIVNALPILIAEAPVAINNFCNAVYSGLGQLVMAGIQMIGSLISGIVDNIPLLIQHAGDIVLAIINVLTLIDLVSVGKNMIIKLGDGIASLEAKIPELFKQIGSKAIELFKSVNWLEAGGKAVDFILNGITNLVPKVVDALWNLGASAISKFKAIPWAEGGKAVIGFIKSGLSSVGSSAVSALKTIGTNAISAFKAIPWASVGQAVLQFIVNGVKAVGSLLVSGLKTVGTNAMSGFKTINWLSLGKNIVSGIAKGVTGAAGTLFSSLKNLASNALSKAKDALGIHSPSTVFADAVGQYIPAGIAVGVDDGTDTLLSSIDNMADASIEQASDLSDRLTEAMTPETPNLGQYYSSLMGMLDTVNSDVPAVKKAKLGIDYSFATQARELASAFTNEIRGTVEGIKNDVVDGVKEGLENVAVTIDGRKAGKLLADPVAANIPATV